MKKIIASVALLLLAGGLTACGPSIEERERAQQLRIDKQREEIKLGKECADNGGEWLYNGWDAVFRCEYSRTSRG